MTEEYNAGEFVSNPSKITSHLVELVAKLNEKHESLLKTKNILKKFKSGFTLRMYMEDGYKEYCSFLINYELPKSLKLEEWFAEFEKLYDKLILNNFVLAYAYTLNNDVSNPVLTMEDKKVLALKKLYDEKLTKQQFDKEFGHYALNAYELSSKRFEEYSEKELMAIAKLAAGLEIKEKTPLEEYMATNPKNKIPILIALRELAKYKVLLVVKEIRYALLDMAKKEKIENIFDKTYEELVH